MSDLREPAFADYVEEYLVDEYGRDAVTREAYLYVRREGARDYVGFVDFLVDGPLTTWAIEVENDADRKHVRQGVGQAVEYAAVGGEKYGERWTPAVIIPDHHDDSPALADVRGDVTIRKIAVGGQ